MLDLYKLYIFSVVAQAHSFSQAAARLYITQSAVSQHMRALEDSVGRPLFERGRRGVRLTPHGERLYEYTRRILALVAEAENALTDVAGLAGGRVSLSATPGIGVHLVPAWIERFRARYPKLTTALQTGVTDQVIAEVLAGHADLGFIEGEIEGLPITQLAAVALDEIEQVAAVGPRHAWWGRPNARLADLEGQPLIARPPNSQNRVWLEKLLTRCNVHPVIGAEFDNMESIKHALVQGKDLAILPRYVVEAEVTAGTLWAVRMEVADGGPLRRTLRVIWARETGLHPISRAFLETVSLDYPALRQAGAGPSPALPAPDAVDTVDTED